MNCKCVRSVTGSWTDIGTNRICLFGTGNSLSALKSCPECNGTGKKSEGNSVLDIINEEAGKNTLTRASIFRAVTRIRIRDRKAADSKITRAISDFGSIIIRCREGGPNVDWLKTIDSIASEAIRKLKP